MKKRFLSLFLVLLMCLTLFPAAAFADGGTNGDNEAINIPTFSDVPLSRWYAPYVSAAVSVGLLKGKSADRFAPADNMTIAEAITLAARLDVMANGLDPDTKLQNGNPWYQTYVDYAKNSGLPWQYSDYNAKITREEFAHIFAAVYKNCSLVFEEVGLTEINSVKDGAIPDVSMNHKYADDIYKLYRLGILGGSDAARNFRPDSNIVRSEVAAIVCRMFDVDRQQFTMN